MMRALLIFTLLSVLASPAWAIYTLHDRPYYSVIISRKPFGDMATAKAQEEAAAVPEQDPVKVEEESNKINLCAMTYTYDGREAVGLIDNGIEPPAYITLFKGEVSNGLELLLVDVEEEYATFRRDGGTFTLGLGLGLLETITPESLAQKEAEEKEAQARKAEADRKRPNSLAEQLIAMQMSLPPDIEAPPLPIPIGDAAQFTKEFDPGRERAAPETESEALIQAGVAQLNEAVATGESPQDYLRRLVEHRQKEVERQQSEKRAAQKALDETLASGQYSEEDAAYLRRRTNIELMKKGVVPLQPVADITADEQAEIDAALNAME